MKSDSLKNKIQAWRFDYWSLFFIFLSFYWLWQKNPVIGDPDGFYHAKIAQILGQGKILHALPWMQFSTLAENFTDHHFLYHIFLIPFVRFSDPLWGVKIAAVLFATLAVLSFYWLLKKLNITFAWLFSLLILTLPNLNFRWSLIKTNSLSFILCLFFIYALLKNKNKLLFALSWLFVWLYGGWPIIFPILLAYFVSIWLNNKISSVKIHYHWQKIIWSLGGILAGLISHPYWPENLYFYWQQVIQIGLINLGNQFAVGGEWYGASFFKILSSAPHLFILSWLFIILLVFNYQKLTQKTTFSLLLSFGFLLLTIKSSRYIEYFLPFLLLFVSFAANDLKSIFNRQNIKNFWLKLNIYLKTYTAISLSILLIVVIPLILNKALTFNLPQRLAFDRFAAASAWLKNNTPEQSIVFHDDWDQWPMLFYHNQKNYYLIGLDPTFMHNYSLDLHQLYLDLGSGQETDDLATTIKEKFHSNYILLEKENKKEELKNALVADQNISLVYEDQEVEIYQIN
ncbi:hypothetical protein H6761_03805 [Candidatus Nomurabacteria bacterium]|nr:hypothetical protein [Candidatus Nomurabacteria bacterium]